MTTQLTLIDELPVEWRLDDRTRESGREGIAKAREALASATPSWMASHDDDHATAA